MRKVWIILIIIFTLTLTSCNYKEVNDMPMVNGMGIDKHDDTIFITLSIVIPTTAAKEASSETVVVEAEGATLFEAVRDLILKDGEKVYFGHLQYLLIGHELASDNINQAIDLIIRDDETREDIWLLITEEEKTAKELIKLGVENEHFRFYIPTALKNSGSISKYYPITVCEYAHNEDSKGISTVLPMVSLEESFGVEKVLIHGGYVIKDEKVGAFLSGKDIQLFRAVSDKEDGGVYVVEYEKDTLVTKVSIEVLDSKSTMKIKKDSKGEYYGEVNINISGVVGEVSNSNVLVIDEENFTDFIEQAEKEIKNDIDELIEKVKKEEEVDIFGFGNVFKRTYPKEFKKVENNWDDVFIGLPIKTNVTLEIKGSSLCRQPLY